MNVVKYLIYHLVYASLNHLRLICLSFFNFFDLSIFKIFYRLLIVYSFICFSLIFLLAIFKHQIKLFLKDLSRFVIKVCQSDIFENYVLRCSSAKIFNRLEESLSTQLLWKSINATRYCRYCYTFTLKPIRQHQNI